MNDNDEFGRYTIESSPMEDFSYEQMRVLEEDQIFLPSATPGMRTVSGALLNPPASQTSGSISSSSGASPSVRHRNFPPSTGYTFDLPESEVSVAALEFIGFTTRTATAIFVNYTTRPNPKSCPDSYLDYVFGHTSRLNMESYRHYPPRQAMTLIGLTPQFQDAILDPRFSQIFSTETTKFWIDDTLRINYLTLLQLQSRLKNHADRSIAEKAKRGSREAIFQPAAPSPVTASLNTRSEDHHLPETYVTVQDASPVLPNHYVLYKAKSAVEMGEPRWIKDDGSIDMRVIETYRGEFNGTDRAVYWTPEAETAEEYRAWTSRRCPWSDTWVIRIQLPATFIDSLRQVPLWYSREWKEYVWHCRKQEDPPDSYCGADIIIGHMSKSTTTPLTRIKQAEVQTAMTEHNLLTIGPRSATQWAFVHSENIHRLQRELLLRGSLHIDISAAAQLQGR